MNRIIKWISATAVGAVALAACGGGDDVSTSAEHHHEGIVPVTASAPATTLDITAMDYAFTVNTQTVATGNVDIQLTNKGTEAHQVHIARAPAGMTVDEFVHAYHDKGERAAFADVTWVGGVSGVEPGAVGRATANLTAGDYFLVCFLPASDGQNHLMKGMVGSLHVSDEPSASSTAPDAPPASETIALSDFHVEIPAGFTGKGTVAVRNDGHANHEMILVRLKDGKTLADAAAYKAGDPNPAPFTYAGGIGIIAPSTAVTADLNLTPGNYIATCFVSSDTGQPHANMGMVATFTVT